MSELIQDGTIQRYLRKTLTVYEERRNHLCSLLQSELLDVINFSVPEGGMTVWTEFNKSINLKKLAKQAYNKGLYISDGEIHKYPTYNENGIRLGFASSSLDSLSKSVEILRALI